MTFQRTIVFLLVFFHTACGADKRAVPEIARDLATVKPQQGVTLDLGQLTLETHEDFDRLESQILSKMPYTRALEVYEALGDNKRAGDARSDALLLARRFVFMFRSTSETSDEAQRRTLIDGAQEIRKTLRETHPDDPHTLFTEGYFSLQIYQVSGLQGRSRANPILGEDIRQQSARELKATWGKLLRIAPDYVGTDGFDTARIRKELEDLDRFPKGGGVERRAEGSIKPIASDNLAIARESLWALENKPQQTASICRDYQKAIKGKVGLALPASFAEADIGFTCGVSLGNRDLALLGLGQLVLRGPRSNVCSDLETIRCREQSRACTKLKDRLAAMGAEKEKLCMAASFFAAQALEVSRALWPGRVPASEIENLETNSLDQVENAQRLRMQWQSDGEITAQAVARRKGHLDGFPRTEAMKAAISVAMTSRSTREEWTLLLGLLLGREDATEASIELATFEGIEGYLLQLNGLGTHKPNQTLDASFFLIEDPAKKTSPNPGESTITGWLVSAISVISGSANRTELQSWAQPRFPAEAEAPKSPPAAEAVNEKDAAPSDAEDRPSSDAKPGPPETTSDKEGKKTLPAPAPGTQ